MEICHMLITSNQAIIPREASRSILLGDASYTLIDDNGIEFYLSPADKENRERREEEGEGDLEVWKKKKKKRTPERGAGGEDQRSLRDLLASDPHYTTVLKAAAAAEEEVEALEDVWRGSLLFLNPSSLFMNLSHHLLYTGFKARSSEGEGGGAVDCFPNLPFVVGDGGDGGDLV